MEIWEEILKDNEILKTYEQINLKTNYVIDHGLVHIKNVIKYIEHICEIFNVQDKTKELALISGTLHDMGYLNSREEHEISSAEYAKEYLKDKLTTQDIDIIADAIIRHNRKRFDYNSNNDVAWILLLADKMDYTRERYIKNLVDDFANSKYSYYIKKIYLTRKKNLVTVNFEFYKNNLKDFYNSIDSMFEIYKRVINHFDCVAEIKFH